MQSYINLIKSNRIKLVSLSVLVFLIIILLAIKFSCGEKTNTTTDTNKKDSLEIIKTDIKKLELVKSRVEHDIDSLVMTFGIHKEWIATNYPNDTTKKSKSEKLKKEKDKVLWFAKSILIPNNLPSAEINLELTNYISSIGLSYKVNEDIRTKDIVFEIIDTVSSGSLSLAKITLTHSDKVQRETSVYALIIGKVWDYSKSEQEEVINKLSGFSYMFPPNLDELEAYNQFTQAKKNIVFRLSLGDKMNQDSDFRIGMSDNEIKTKVKSIKTDFAAVKTILLNKTSSEIPDQRLFYSIIQEFSRNEVKVVNDSALTVSPSKDAAGIMNLLRSSREKKIILINEISFGELMRLYTDIAVLKKLGNKFYTLSDFFAKEDESRRKQIQLEQKKQEEDKKKTEVKKVTKKVEPKKVTKIPTTKKQTKKKDVKKK